MNPGVELHIMTVNGRNVISSMSLGLSWDGHRPLSSIVWPREVKEIP